MKRLAICLPCVLVFALCLSCSSSDSGVQDTVPDGTTDLSSADAAVPAEDTLVEQDQNGGTDTVTQVDEEPPNVTLNVVPYTAMSGAVNLDATWSDNESVVRVELVVDDVSLGELDMATKLVDTTQWTAGLHQLSLHAFDASGNRGETEPIPVLCAGPGRFLQFTDGWTEPTIPGGWGGFELMVPMGAESVYDEKVHVDVPAGAKSVMGFLRFKCKTVWDIGFDMGTGDCPHSGELLAAEDMVSSEGFIQLQYDDGGNALPIGMWFIHIRFNDGGDHDGEAALFDGLFLALP